MALKKLKTLPPTIYAFSVSFSWLGRSLTLAPSPYFIFKNGGFEGKKGEIHLKKSASTLHSGMQTFLKVVVDLSFPNDKFFKSRHLLVIPK